MNQVDRNKWRKIVKEKLDEIAPPCEDEMNSLCVFYCPHTQNFGVYNTSEEVISDFVEKMDGSQLH